MNPLLELSHVSFSYGKNDILKEISLKIEKGDLCCLLGPSGCGKTSLIRMIAGFEQPTSGVISIDNIIVADKKTNVPAEKRNVGMVFQDLTLFPHLTIEKNIAFGLEHVSNDQRKQRIDELLDLCQLKDLKKRYPHQISGGQQQRVALARALAPKPQLLLLDEPFSSVDSSLQRQLAQEVRDMIIADQATAIWVTHDLNEAFAIADKIGLVIDGSLQQWSSPKDLYYKPENEAVARFMNHSEFVNGQILDNTHVMTVLGTIRVTPENNQVKEKDVNVLIHKKDFIIDHHRSANAKLVSRVYLGGQYQVTALLNDGNTISFYITDDVEYSNGDEVCISTVDKDYQTYQL